MLADCIAKYMMADVVAKHVMADVFLPFVADGIATCLEYRQMLLP